MRANAPHWTGRARKTRTRQNGDFSRNRARMRRGSGSDDAGGTSHRGGAVGHRRVPKRPRPTVGRVYRKGRVYVVAVPLGILPNPGSRHVRCVTASRDWKREPLYRADTPDLLCVFGWRVSVQRMAETPSSARYSQTIVAAARDVTSATSNDGETSTISMPTKRISPSRRRIACACHDASPPISGVPVPGAKAGSSASMSKLR